VTSVCLLVVWFFSEQGKTMQRAVWIDEHEHKAKTETDQNCSFGFQENKKLINFFVFGKLKTETAVSGRRKPKTEPTLKFSNR